MDTIKNVSHTDHVTIQFGGVVAVNGPPLDVNEHEIVALIGPNGAGRTTASSCVADIYQLTYGFISFNSQIVLADTPQGKMHRLYASDAEPTALAPVRKTPDQTTRPGITGTSQDIRLFGSLTVFENVLITKHTRAKQNIFSAALRLNHVEGKWMRGESFGLLEMQGLVHLKDKTASSLSYGLRRRLETTRALATSPSLLFPDEPATGMNPQRTQDLTDLIKQICDDYHLTTFMTRHHMDLAMQIPDRIYVLGFGRPIAQGTSDGIQNDPKVIEAYLGVSDDVND